MTKAVLQGDFVDLRFLKSRKVVQVIVEFPIETGPEIVAAFGTPNPAITVPVALARLTDGVAEKKGGKLAQQAGIMGGEAAFQAYVQVNDNSTAAEQIRQWCGVKSRAELDHNEIAAAKFRELKRAYEAWKLL